jgi:hypothetical protein
VFVTVVEAPPPAVRVVVRSCVTPLGVVRVVVVVVVTLAPPWTVAPPCGWPYVRTVAPCAGGGFGCAFPRPRGPGWTV